MLRLDRMLFGSLRAAAAAPGVPLTPDVPAPEVVAPPAGAVAVGAPSSTGAGVCVSVLLQPASAAMMNAATIHLRMRGLLDLEGVTAAAGPRRVRARRLPVRRAAASRDRRRIRRPIYHAAPAAPRR